MLSGKQAVRSVGLSLVLILMGTGSAVAATKTYAGLLLKDDGNVVGEIDTTTSVNNKYWLDLKDPNGDRMKIQAPTRDRRPANGRGVHVSVSWTRNGSYCYVSGIGEGAQISCGDGWVGDGTTSTKDTQDSAWTFWVISKAIPGGNSESLRGGIRICESQAWSDPCTGNRYVGVSWK